ncbi:hypothetical protein M758_UG124900, partial [Ceratodon purpureus]
MVNITNRCHLKKISLSVRLLTNIPSWDTTLDMTLVCTYVPQLGTVSRLAQIRQVSSQRPPGHLRGCPSLPFPSSLVKLLVATASSLY